MLLPSLNVTIEEREPALTTPVALSLPANREGFFAQVKAEHTKGQ